MHSNARSCRRECVRAYSNSKCCSATRYQPGTIGGLYCGAFVGSPDGVFVDNQYFGV